VYVGVGCTRFCVELETAYLVVGNKINFHGWVFDIFYVGFT